MVAYSFAPQFLTQVAALTKRQTVRADRKRHARPEEPIQLYTAMRTKHCRKLVDPDPICRAVRRIEIVTSLEVDELVASIAIDGMLLDAAAIEAFAAEDGFAPAHFGLVRFPRSGALELRPSTARYWMGWWWLRVHGAKPFEGVVIQWVPS